MSDFEIEAMFPGEKIHPEEPAPTQPAPAVTDPVSFPSYVPVIEASQRMNKLQIKINDLAVKAESPQGLHTSEVAELLFAYGAAVRAHDAALEAWVEKSRVDKLYEVYGNPAVR